MVKYIPQEKDIIYVDFSPVLGHEQMGKRPALVVSSKLFNEFTNMALVCPITNNTKVFPTHYELRKTNVVIGSVLCEHIRSIDYTSRNAEFVEKCNDKEFKDITELIKSFMNECERMEDL